MTDSYGKTSARGRALFVVLALVAGTIGIAPAFADHGTVGLAGSDFEIDVDANLTVEHDAPSIDWASVDYDVQVDQPSGSDDDSFGQGSKEDTATPSVVSGSIPPNKSDLKSFGLYQEKNANGEFLHLFWTRVQDPSGTTNMDFEFNQSTTLSANGVTPVRTVDDLLITYDLSKGGTVPVLSLRKWDGSAWGSPELLTNAGDAAGSINTSPITEGGLGDLDPRTFGEASIDLDVILGGANTCQSFGSVYLKSRSSDSFTSALKDFIAPMDVNISNCGSVTVKKVTVPANTGGDFSFTTTLQTQGTNGPVAATIDDLAHNESDTISNVLPGTGLTITETAKSGWVLTDVTCTIPDGDDEDTDPDEIDITWEPDGADPTKVTFDVNDQDQVTCTFTNTGLGSITIQKETVGDFGQFTIADGDQVSGGSSFDITTSEGNNPQAHTTFSNLVAGTYDFSETVPSGWVLTGIECSGDTDSGSTYGGTGSFTEGDTAVAVDLDPGEAITCTFTNTKLGRLDITKTDDAGNALEGVSFTLWIDADPDDTDTGHDSNSGDTVTSFTCTTNAAGTCSIENVPLGDYWAVESTPPSSSIYSGAADQKVSITAGADLDLTFENPRLHKVIVLVCHAGTDTLVASDVTYGTDGEITTIDTGEVSADLEATLCDLAGIDELEHGEFGLTVDVGTEDDVEHD